MVLQPLHKKEKRQKKKREEKEDMSEVGRAGEVTEVRALSYNTSLIILANKCAVEDPS